MSICHLVGAGDFDKPSLSVKKGDLVIACDGGLSYLEKAGIVPDLVVGDFDSLGRIPTGENVTLLPKEKDDTDLLYGAKLGLSKKYDRFILHGSLGGKRFSHSLANLALLAFLLDNGAKGVLHANDVSVALLEKGCLSLPKAEGYFSFFACGGNCDFALSGMKYPFDGILSPFSPLCVSNEANKECSVTVKSGRLLFVYEGSDLDPLQLIP